MSRIASNTATSTVSSSGNQPTLLNTVASLTWTTASSVALPSSQMLHGCQSTTLLKAVASPVHSTSQQSSFLPNV